MATETNAVAATCFCADHDGDSGLGELIAKQELIQMAGQYTSCPGCSAAVKSLLERPFEDGSLRLISAVMREPCEGSSYIQLRQSYQEDPARVRKLLAAFPMSKVAKKVQPAKGSRRCIVHKRLCNVQNDGGPWEDMWYALPDDKKEEVICF